MEAVKYVTLAQAVAVGAIRKAVNRPMLEAMAGHDHDPSLDAIVLHVGPPNEHRAARFLVYPDGSVVASRRADGCNVFEAVTVGHSFEDRINGEWYQNLDEAVRELKEHVAKEWEWTGRDFVRKKQAARS